MKTAVIAAAVVLVVRLAERQSDRRFTIALVLVALALRFGWLMLVNPHVEGDAAWYHERAIGLAAGQGFSIDGTPTAHFPPLYPLLLSVLYRLVGPSVFLVQMCNTAAAIAVILLTMALASALFGRSIARLSGVLMAVWPGQIPYAATLLAEPVAEVLILAASWLALTRLRAGSPAEALSLGVLLGAATLIKPAAAAYIVVVLALAWLAGVPARRVAAAGGVGLLGVALVVAPWAYRNYRVFGAFVPLTTSSGLVLWEGNHPGANGLPSDAIDNPFRKIPGEVVHDRLARDAAVAFIRADPARAARLYVARLYRIFETDSEVAASAFAAGRPLPAPIPVVYGRLCTTYFNAVMLLFCLFVAWPIWNRRPVPGAPSSASGWRSRLIVLAPAAYFGLLQAVFLAQYRYNYPSLPFMAVGAAAALGAAAFRPIVEADQPIPCEARAHAS